MSDLSKTITTYLSHTKKVDYKTKYQTTIKSVGGKWFIDHINFKLPHIQRRRFSKIEQIKKRKNLRKAS